MYTPFERPCIVTLGQQTLVQLVQVTCSIRGCPIKYDISIKKTIDRKLIDKGKRPEGTTAFCG